MVSSKPPFKGLRLHHVFAVSLEDLHNDELSAYINKLGWPTKEGVRHYHPTYTEHHLAEKEKLDKINEFLVKDAEFVDPRVIHISSDLGLPYKITTRTKDGDELEFDGMYLRVTKSISEAPLMLSDLPKKTQCPKLTDPIIERFMGHVVQTVPQLSVYSGTYYAYYTVTETDWDGIGFTRSGETRAQGQINLTDMNYLTVTALVLAKRGKDYQIYFGEEAQIHEMIANDFAILEEVRLRNRYLSMKIDTLARENDMMLSCYRGTILPGWQIAERRRRWADLKKIIIIVHQIQNDVENGMTYSEALNFLKENEKAFFNVPRQIAIGGEPLDLEVKNKWPTKQFTWFEIEDSRLVIKGTRIDHLHEYAREKYNSTLNRLVNLEEKTHRNARDLVTEYQTDFTIDALVLALAAVVVASFLTILGVLTR